MFFLWLRPLPELCLMPLPEMDIQVSSLYRDFSLLKSLAPAITILAGDEFAQFTEFLRIQIFFKFQRGTAI